MLGALWGWLWPFGAQQEARAVAADRPSIHDFFSAEEPLASDEQRWFSGRVLSVSEEGCAVSGDVWYAGGASTADGRPLCVGDEVRGEARRRSNCHGWLAARLEVNESAWTDGPDDAERGHNQLIVQVQQLQDRVMTAVADQERVYRIHQDCAEISFTPTQGDWLVVDGADSIPAEVSGEQRVKLEPLRKWQMNGEITFVSRQPPYYSVIDAQVYFDPSAWQPQRGPRRGDRVRCVAVESSQQPSGARHPLSWRAVYVAPLEARGWLGGGATCSAPTAPDTRQTHVVVPGVPAFKPAPFISARLPPYPLPPRLLHMTADDLLASYPHLAEPLTPDNYRHKLKLLLFIEEVEMRRRIRKFDMHGAAMSECGGDYLQLHVPGLAEGRPSLVVGDKALLSHASEHAGLVYEGCIHEVRHSCVLLRFNPEFQQRYTGQEYDVVFEFSRSTMRQMHRAVETALTRLPSVLNIPQRLNSVTPQVHFVEEEMDVPCGSSEESPASSCLQTADLSPVPTSEMTAAAPVSDASDRVTARCNTAALPTESRRGSVTTNGTVDGSHGMSSSAVDETPPLVSKFRRLRISESPDGSEAGDARRASVALRLLKSPPPPSSARAAAIGSLHDSQARSESNPSVECTLNGSPRVSANKRLSSLTNGVHFFSQSSSGVEDSVSVPSSAASNSQLDQSSRPPFFVTSPARTAAFERHRCNGGSPSPPTAVKPSDYCVPTSPPTAVKPSDYCVPTSPPTAVKPSDYCVLTSPPTTVKPSDYCVPTSPPTAVKPSDYCVPTSPPTAVKPSGHCVPTSPPTAVKPSGHCVPTSPPTAGRNGKQRRCTAAPTVPLLRWFNRRLNSRQRAAVRRVLEGTARPLPYIIYGPPGTGKTITLVECILQTYRLNTRSRLLVATPSNSSADLITERLHDSGALRPASLAQLRSYNRAEESVPEPVRPYLVSVEQLETAARRRIVVGTAMTAGNLWRLQLREGHFTHVFIDEAGHMTEPETLVAAALMSATDGQLVLAGDPRQLGPVLQSRCAAVWGLQTSLLERVSVCRLYGRDPRRFADHGSYNPQLVTKLVHNYRSHEQLLTVPSRLFYDAELVARADPAVVQRWCRLDWLPATGFPMLFHGIRGENLQEGDSPSWYNPGEAFQVVRYLQKLATCGVDWRQVGVISPYRKQTQKVRQLMDKFSLPPVKIGSVEEFQGQEREIIILTTVRSAAQNLGHDIFFHLGFMQSPKRFNVCITRAKSLMIVIGNPDLLGLDENWRQLLEHAVNNGAYTGTPLDATSTHTTDFC